MKQENAREHFKSKELLSKERIFVKIIEQPQYFKEVLKMMGDEKLSLAL